VTTACQSPLHRPANVPSRTPARGEHAQACEGEVSLSDAANFAAPHKASMVHPNDTQIGDVIELSPLVSGFFTTHTINCSGHPCGPPPPLCEVGQAAMLTIKSEGFGLCAHSQQHPLELDTPKILLRGDRETT
jgi:hypothetical protein